MKNILKTILERLKSPVVLGTIVSQIIIIVTLFNPEMAEQYKIALTAIIEILTLFGVLNNPDDRNKF